MTLPWKCADCKDENECQCPQLSGAAEAQAQAEWEQERAEWYAEAALAQYDDDPNPYHGDYSEL